MFDSFYFFALFFSCLSDVDNHAVFENGSECTVEPEISIRNNIFGKKANCFSFILSEKMRIRVLISEILLC